MYVSVVVVVLLLSVYVCVVVLNTCGRVAGTHGGVWNVHTGTF